MYNLYKNKTFRSKDDILIAYEFKVNERSNKPINNIYLSKKNTSSSDTEDSDEDNENDNLPKLKVDSNDNFFSPVPYVKDNEISAISYFIAGVSGSGKSHYTSQLVNNILTLKRFNNIGHLKEAADVYLITSAVLDDPAYEKSLKKYFKLDINHDDFFNLTFSDFKNCIVIFDDVTSMSNKNTEIFIARLQKSIGENSRKSNVAMVSISHQSRDFNKTKYLIHEANYYVLFPHASWNDSKKFLKSYLDYDDNQLKKIKKISTKTRGICIHKCCPIYTISDKLIYLD